jgi:hypothetical protein
MSYKEHRFLWWSWQTHKHEWVEENRDIYIRKARRFDYPPVTIGSYTLFLWRCRECSAVRVQKMEGEWTGVKK